jgi:ribosomal protein S6--L-glutamate ligase
MIKDLIMFNGDKPRGFSEIFDKVATNKNLNSRHIKSKECVISIGYGDKSKVHIVHNNEVLPRENAAYVIKRTGKDIYRIYLISQILHSEALPLFVDEANILSDKSADKITMMAQLSLNGIEVPKSILTTFTSYLSNKEYVEKLTSYPCVVKKAGSKGKTVWKIENQRELEECLSTDDNMSLIQEYIPNDYDIRVFVLDGEFLVAIKRSSVDGFYNNVSQGGKAEKIDLTEDEKLICIKATSIAKLRLAGVDMVRTEKGPLIFEVNKTPQLDIFSQSAGFDIEKIYSEKIIDFLVEASEEKT